MSLWWQPDAVRRTRPRLFGHERPIRHPASHQRGRPHGRWIDRAAHRPVRAHHARGGAGRRHRAAAVQFRGVRQAAAGRSSLRRGRRHRTPAGRDRAVPVRRRRAGRAGRGRGGGPPGAGPAGRLPVRRRCRRLPGRGAVLPRLPGAHRDRLVRRGGGPRDAGAFGDQPRLRGGLGRRPDGHRGGRSAADRDGLPAHPRGRRRRPRLGPLTWRASPRRPTWRPAAGTVSRPPVPPRTRSCCCTTPRSGPTPGRWPPSG